MAVFFLMPGIQAQDAGTDSLPVPPKPKPRVVSNIIFQFDNRNEKYYDVAGRMNGLRIGVEFYKRARLGFGFYENNNFYELRYPNRPEDISRTVEFRYTTNFVEWVLFRNFRWEVAQSFAFGKGHFTLNNFDVSASAPEFIGKDSITRVPLFDVGLHTHYKIFPWLGVGAGLGYRKVSVKGYPELQDAFTNPYLDFKIKLFMGYVYKAIFKPENIASEKAYYDWRREERKKYCKNLLKR